MSDPSAPAPAVPASRHYVAAAAARGLLRTVRSGALATLAPDGGPFASLVTVASLPDGAPVLPLSTLAMHTQHLIADPRCSLLLDSAGKGDPLVHPRLTVTALARRATEGERDAWRTRFLRRHPKAELYVDFGDFSFWRLEPVAARMIGGFGRIDALPASDLLTDTAGAEALVGGETRSLDHMNADHRDALKLYATALCGAPDGDWRLVGIDPGGIDLACRDETLRLDFPERILDPVTLRRQLVAWVKAAEASAAA